MLPRMILALAGLFVYLSVNFTALGAVPRDFAIDLKASVSEVAPRITISWSQRVQSSITGQKIYRRLKGELTWELQATLTTTQTSYIDASALAGVEYEYWMERKLTGIYPSTAMGYLSAGVGVPFVETRGLVLLVIDDTMVTGLAPEIAQLQRDLVGDGWTVQTITALRSATAVTVKGQIQAAYNANPGTVKAVYLLGHVPVPYSGVLAPDGHSDHYGAWPADGYYGDMNGTWTDSTANSSTASSTRNRNIPGDGKFDQSTFPSLLELEVGRVDLSGMTKAPASAVSETALLRRYLRKEHAYRHKLGLYANIPRRTLIRDGFGYFGGENFAISGWAGGFTGAGQPPSAPVDEPPSGQWFSSTYAGGQSYLIGHGNGGGSYESASSVGSSTDFGRKTSRVVFPSIFGSYHGDWDSANNLLRAPLAGNATEDSLGLICFWSGRPNWFLHHFGMGEPIGYSTRLSQNAGLAGGGGYIPGNSSLSGVHVGLMGDPTLRLHMVEPPRNLVANSVSSQISLNWAASTESGLLGYHVYRGATPSGPFTRLTTSVLTLPGYVDAAVTAGNSYTYLVRTLKLETAPGGTYQNLSQGSLITLAANSNATTGPLNPTGLTVQVGQLSWVDNSDNETGFRIERKLNAGGAYTSLTTLGAGVTSFTDLGPFTQGNVYSYRVFATNAVGDSLPSEEVSFDAVAGFFDLTSTTKKVSKTAGVATFTVNRFGGAIGAVAVNYATSNSSAIAGTHYTATTGTLNWASGELGTKTFTVPITATGTPQLPRQFKVTLSSPTGGTAIAAAANTAVLIEDSSATLSAPWSQVLLGAITDSSPAVSAEGVLGTAGIGGAGVSASATSEAGKFIHQMRNGDGVMTAFIPTPTPAQTAARFALMVRATPTNTAAMAAAVTSGDAVNYGAKLVSRATTGASAIVLPSVNNNFSTARWLRLTRAGNTFIAEASTDAISWTALGSATVTLPDTAYWGLFHYSGDLATTTSNLGDYQLATFQSFSLTNLSAPAAPPNFTYSTPAATQVSLSWSVASFAAGYRIEKRAENGSFTQIADLPASTGVYTDSSVLSDKAYEYRILAYNSVGESPWALVRAVTPLPDVTSSITTDGLGSADATIRYDSPSTALGAANVLTMAGTTSGLPTTLAKTYFRFDLTGFPSLRSAKLKCAFVAPRGLDSTHYAYGQFYLLSEASDVWGETTIHWNNAPQNNLANAQLLTPTQYLGNYYLSGSGPFPAAGTLLSFDFAAATLNANRGANNLISIAFIPTDSNDSGGIDFAAREHPTLPPPTLEIVHSPLQPLRPSFLTVVAGAGQSVDLTWVDNSNNETEFEIERRIIGGAFSLLQTLPQNSIAFNDNSRAAGITYEYRVRAAGVTGNSSWSPIVADPIADTLTALPTLTKPASAAVLGHPIEVQFSLPEAAAAGTLKLKFNSLELVLANPLLTPGAHSFSFTPANPTESAEIAAGPSIPDGLYTVTLSYQDVSLNAAASAVSSGMRIDNTAPIIVGPFSPLAFDSSLLPDYTSQAMPVDDTAVTVTQFPLPGSSVPLGQTTVTITATDVIGNRSTQSFGVLSIRPAPTHLALFQSGELAPGAGTADGPAADALLSTFGLPAIDHDGSIAYRASWRSVLAGNGSGLFRDNLFLARVGGTLGSILPELPTAKFRSFTDPVLAGGRIAFMATLSGAPVGKSAVIISDAPTGSLAVIAQSGMEAAGTDGARFKSFRSIAVGHEVVAIFAQLASGAGSPKTTAANDLGLWIKHGSAPLALVLREGQVFNGKVIKSLVSFRSGAGSPGHGRGWLIESDEPEVMALAFFADAAHSQAVLVARPNGVVRALSETGPDGVGAPDVTDATFARYGLPSANDSEHSAFLGSLTLGLGDVSLKNARGVFVQRSGTTYTAIARAGDIVLNGAAFSTFKDPVLGPDDALAFAATLRGGTQRGIANSTLWWKPVAGDLSLLAQGGAQPPETPLGTQWRAFTSLAISNGNAPIFAATLVPGKGGATAATGAGVWAKDFFGETRLLFRNGVTTLLTPEKTLKSFQLLRSLRGSTGVTHSFNDQGDVIWLATFGDRSQAIIRTSIP